MFGESGFAHGDFLSEQNQYAGSSLKVNGPICRDAYMMVGENRAAITWIRDYVIECALALFEANVVPAHRWRAFDRVLKLITQLEHGVYP